MESDDGRRGTSRRRFVKQLGGAVFGFVAVGRGLVLPSVASAAAVCANSRRYRVLAFITETEPPWCYYDYYDKITGKYCTYEFIPC